ncbi:hypothetical protein D3C78_1090980 [compost metagenome]
MQVIGDLATDAFTQTQAVTVGAQRRQGQVLVASGRAREQRFAPFDVISKTTGRQDHSLAGMNADRAARGLDQCTADATLLLEQVLGGC